MNFDFCDISEHTLSITDSLLTSNMQTQFNLHYWLYVTALIFSFEFLSLSNAAAESECKAFFAAEQASDHVRLVADWVVNSHDNHGMPFVILDKKQTKIFVFDADGQILGATQALLGMTVGDYDTEGVGNKSLAQIPPQHRITPAGRYVAHLGKNLHGGLYLWIDYDAGLAIHAVVNVPGQKRLERLASQDPKEHRISWGCINVPVNFFDSLICPIFKNKGFVYILPETKSPVDFFGITSANSISKNEATSAAKSL